MKKITFVHMDSAGCSEHENGISALKLLVENKQKVIVDRYGGFEIIHIGSPKTIWLPDRQAQDFMRKDLENGNGILVYWDFASVAFVVKSTQLSKTIEEFFMNITKVEECEGYHQGINLTKK